MPEDINLKKEIKTDTEIKVENELFVFAKSLGKKLQKSKIFKKFKEADELMKNDAQLQKNLQEFNILKLDAENLMYKTDSKNRKNYDALSEKIRDLYEKIWGNSNMVSFNKNKSQLVSVTQKMINILTIASDGADLDDETAYDENFLTPERSGLGGCCSSSGCNGCDGGCC